MAFEDLHRPLGAAGFNGVTRWMIILSGTLLLLLQFFGQTLLPLLGLVPDRVLSRGWLWQPFTYVFLHGGIFHWLFNMFVFWMFGRELEVRWGARSFLLFCVITALGAALSVILISPHSTIPTIGSSGIVFGLLVAFALAYPHATMYLYFLIPMKVWQVAVLFGVIELLTIKSQGTAAWAHLGGMATAYIYLKRPWDIVWRWRPSWPKRSKTARAKLHVVTDDLAQEVDRILDKVLKEGAESLTAHEKKMMDQYVAKKR